jgi:acetylornithine deacetylase/succinyl-diaminopimelate desuccinylase-like protein
MSIRSSRRLVASLALCAGVAAPLLAQSPAAVRATARAWREANEWALVRELAEFAAIPNLARDSAGIARNAAWLVRAFEREGFTMRTLDGRGGTPVVTGELRVPGATRTILLYAHYDGQPVDPSQWRSDPWRPQLRGPRGDTLALAGTGRPDPEARLYGRSTSDDKGPIVAVLGALRALRAAGARPSVNVRLFLEGEEEAGSPHLRAVLETHRATLAGADAWLFLDGPVHQSRRLQVVFGARGTYGLELTTYGPIKPVHSGHYGNWAPNPALQMAEVLSSMRSADGTIRIAGFLDDVPPPTASERAAIAALPPIDAALREELALGWTEANGATLADRLMLPSINVRGIRSGGIRAQAANVVPSLAGASVDFRLVPNQTPDRVRARVEAHFRGLGWTVVDEEPDSAMRARTPKLLRLEWREGGYPSVRTPLDAPVSRALVAAATEAMGEPPLRLPTLGGSLPLAPIVEVLGVPVIVLPTVNHDNNQHAADENLRLRNLFEAVDLFVGVLHGLDRHWPTEPARPRPRAHR